jgi:hypothetical protein
VGIGEHREAIVRTTSSSLRVLFWRRFRRARERIDGGVIFWPSRRLLVQQQIFPIDETDSDSLDYCLDPFADTRAMPLLTIAEFPPAT